MADIKFVDGLRAYKPRDNAPEFVKASLVINRAELETWLRNQGDEVRIDVKESGKTGNWYCAVNEWKRGPERLTEPTVEAPPPVDTNESEIPF